MSNRQCFSSSNKDIINISSDISITSTPSPGRKVIESVFSIGPLFLKIVKIKSATENLENKFQEQNTYKPIKGLGNYYLCLSFAIFHVMHVSSSFYS